MQTSYKKLLEFEVVGRDYMKNDPDSKMSKSIESIIEQIEPLREAFIKKRKKIELKHALEDEKGKLVKNEKGGYEYSRQGEGDRDDEIETLFESNMEFSIDPEYVAEVKKSLSKLQINKMKGFVIGPETVLFKKEVED